MADAYVAWCSLIPVRCQWWAARLVVAVERALRAACALSVCRSGAAMGVMWGREWPTLGCPLVSPLLV